MVAALAFGAYYHFLVPDSDNAAAVPVGPWRGPFVWTAALVALTDAAGVIAGAYLWLGGDSA